MKVDVPIHRSLLETDDLNRRMMLSLLDASFAEVGLDDVGLDELVKAYDSKETRAFWQSDEELRTTIDRRLSIGEKTLEFSTNVQTVEDAIDFVQQRRALRAELFREGQRRVREASEHAGDFLADFYIAKVKGAIGLVNDGLKAALWPAGQVFGFEAPQIDWKPDYVSELTKGARDDWELGAQLAIGWGPAKLFGAALRSGGPAGSLAGRLNLGGLPIGKGVLTAVTTDVMVGAAGVALEEAFEAGQALAVLLSDETTPEQKEEALDTVVDFVAGKVFDGLTDRHGGDRLPSKADTESTFALPNDQALTGDREPATYAAVTPEALRSSAAAEASDASMISGTIADKGASGPWVRDEAGALHCDSDSGTPGEAEPGNAPVSVEQNIPTAPEPTNVVTAPDPHTAGPVPDRAGRPTTPADKPLGEWAEVVPDQWISPDGRIKKIEMRRAEDGTHQYRITGEVASELPGRLHMEDWLTAIPGQQRAHAWGRSFGSETGYGVMHAPPWFNGSVQRYAEIRVGDVYTAAERSGNRVMLEVTVTSQPHRAEHLGAVHYRVWEVAPDGTTEKHLDFEMQLASDGMVFVSSWGTEPVLVNHSDLTDRFRWKRYPRGGPRRARDASPMVEGDDTAGEGTETASPDEPSPAGSPASSSGHGVGGDAAADSSLPTTADADPVGEQPRAHDDAPVKGEGPRSRPERRGSIGRATKPSTPPAAQGITALQPSPLRARP